MSGSRLKATTHDRTSSKAIRPLRATTHEPTCPDQSSTCRGRRVGSCVEGRGGKNGSERSFVFRNDLGFYSQTSRRIFHIFRPVFAWTRPKKPRRSVNYMKINWWTDGQNRARNEARDASDPPELMKLKVTALKFNWHLFDDYKCPLLLLLVLNIYLLLLFRIVEISIVLIYM